MKELDVLLERYYGGRYATAAPAQQAAFARLLAHEDPELLRWLVNGDPPPAEYDDVVRAIRRHA